ncbi:MAG: hypothetical protein LJE85_07620, partial [Gammaproteobacteria bacterium]|nr:hypothetical protein [Gammaproteobacteria bacterium]
MQPTIIKWTYLALGWVLLNNALTVLLAVETGEIAMLTMPSPTIMASILAIVGLITLAPWSRVVAIVVISIQAISTILASIHFTLATECSVAEWLLSSIVVDILLLFLAYRL